MFAVYRLCTDEYMNNDQKWDDYDPKKTKLYKREINAIIASRDFFNCWATRPGETATVVEIKGEIK